MVPEESQCNFCCKCACSVSAAPLDSRIYVMCSLCFVMFQSLFVFCFVQFFQFIQFHSCRDFRGLRCNPAASTMTQPSSPSPTSGQEGRSSCPTGQKTSTQPPKSFRSRWMMTSGQYVPFYPLPRWRARDQIPNLITSNTDGTDG